MSRDTIVWLAVLGVYCSADRDGDGREPPATAAPPKAAVIPKKLEKFGRTRVDDYYWLNDRNDPKVIAYLEAENAYTDARTSLTKALQ
jgi:hypothetical protein